MRKREGRWRGAGRGEEDEERKREHLVFT